MALSTEDRRLAREVIAWARSEGWRPCMGGWIRWVGNREQRVLCGRPPARHGLRVASGDVTILEARTVRGVEQAVDLLVAWTYLPREFSSAYREGVDNVTDLSVMHAIDAKVDEMWEAFQLAHVQHAIVDRLAHLLKADSPFDLRHAAKEITTVVADVLEQEVS